MNLHIVTVLLGSQAVRLVFRERTRAEDLLGVIRSGERGINIKDDFGTTLVDLSATPVALILTDQAAELNGTAELEALRAHANIDFQKRMAADAKVRGAQTLLQPAPSGLLRQ